MLNKKLSKNKICIILTAMMMLSMLISVTADSISSANKTLVFKYGNEEILISSSIGADKAKIIADNLANKDNPTIQPKSILCIFGHDISYANAISVSHYVNSTSPRCYEYRYQIAYCTRSSCGYSSETLISSGSIGCH